MSGFLVHCFFFLALSGGIVLNDVSAFLDKYLEIFQNFSIIPTVDDPDMYLDTLEIIRRNGYIGKSHTVITEDGYILKMFQIVGPKGAKPVYLQHGFEGTSDQWMGIDNECNLAFKLSDAGYDVWLGNFRGNTYSNGHVKLSTTDREYWNFSFPENAIFDLTAMLRCIHNISNHKIVYVGHSMGTAAQYVMAIERPEDAKLILRAISLASVTFTDGMRGVIALLAPFGNFIKFILDMLYKGDLFYESELIDWVAKYICAEKFIGAEICANVLFSVVGYDSEQLDRKKLPMIVKRLLGGASTMQANHFAQEFMSGKFQQYDYGTSQNQKMYNSSMPPEYDLSKMNVPVTIFYSPNDYLSSQKDMEKSVKKMPNVSAVIEVPNKKWSHIDYLFAKDACKFYLSLVEMIKKDV